MNKYRISDSRTLNTLDIIYAIDILEAEDMAHKMWGPNVIVNEIGPAAMSLWAPGCAELVAAA